MDEEGGESEMEWERVIIRRNNNEEEPEREQVKERLPKMKHKEGGQQREIKVVIREGR